MFFPESLQIGFLTLQFSFFGIFLPFHPLKLVTLQVLTCTPQTFSVGLKSGTSGAKDCQNTRIWSRKWRNSIVWCFVCGAKRFRLDQNLKILAVVSPKETTKIGRRGKISQQPNKQRPPRPRLFQFRRNDPNFDLFGLLSQREPEFFLTHKSVSSDVKNPSPTPAVIALRLTFPNSLSRRHHHLGLLAVLVCLANSIRTILPSSAL